jgi:uncharacterized phiE125 gp8 family phage protein
MMLVERTKIPAAVLPVADLRRHLRLGTGFADEGAQDSLLDSFLRAAIAAVEAWTGKVLVTREFTWVLEDWREDRAQPLPVAPVTAITAIRRIDVLEAVNVVDPGLYRLQRDAHRPLILATGPCLPPVPEAGSIEVDFTAGFGASWADVPPDLAHAVVLLAAHYHEYRAELRAGHAAIPYGVSVLAEPWRTMRILGGGGRR